MNVAISVLSFGDSVLDRLMYWQHAAFAPEADKTRDGAMERQQQSIAAAGKTREQTCVDGAKPIAIEKVR
jgi:hypothetical protein